MRPSTLFILAMLPACSVTTETVGSADPSNSGADSGASSNDGGTNINNANAVPPGLLPAQAAYVSVSFTNEHVWISGTKPSRASIWVTLADKVPPAEVAPAATGTCDVSPVLKYNPGPGAAIKLAGASPTVSAGGQTTTLNWTEGAVNTGYWATLPKGVSDGEKIEVNFGSGFKRVVVARYTEIASPSCIADPAPSTCFFSHTAGFALPVSWTAVAGTKLLFVGSPKNPTTIRCLPRENDTSITIPANIMSTLTSGNAPFTVSHTITQQARETVSGIVFETVSMAYSQGQLTE